MGQNEEIFGRPKASQKRGKIGIFWRRRRLEMKKMKEENKEIKMECKKNPPAAGKTPKIISDIVLN